MEASPVAQWAAALLVGFLSPFAQEIITQGRFTGRTAIFISAIVTPAAGAIALWFFGGFAGLTLPAATLLDPSPVAFFLLGMWSKIAIVSRVTYSIPGVGATSAVVAVGPKGGLSVSAAGTPGLVQKIAGTGNGTPSATTTPTA